ncbi:unnamed protein product [Haemonchus placei]|uniref:WD_REPEATS_REGION domain-containing protein n=1 Tax=Haemonchus placei TaxID=6290 RepID=A0A0N4W7W5_HAEPC|nr:unnamed protein product [Haemonchus placei]
MEVDERPVSADVVIEDAALVQADWDLVLKEMSNPKFYVGRRKYGEGSVFANVEKSGDNFVCADEEIQISVQQSCRDLKGHVMDVYKCRFFPSGLVVLSAGMDMTVKIWSVDTGLCPRTLKGHTMAVSDIAIIGVGREVLSCSHDGTVIKWLCADGSQQEQWKPEAGPCNAIAISKDSKVFAVCCEAKKCMMYSVEGPTLSTIVTDNVPTAICIDYESDHIVYIGDEEGMVSVFDTRAGSFIYRLQTNRGRVMKAVTRDEGLFVAYRDGSVCCYPRDSSKTNVSCPIYEFTGSDCDPVNLYFQIAKAQALKTPSMVALDHCDFYYGPMFGKHWPSIRLGLLSPNKYVAVMNTFSRDCAVHEEFLKQSGTIDLLAKIRGKTAAERIEEKRQRVNSIARKETESALKKMVSPVLAHSVRLESRRTESLTFRVEQPEMPSTNREDPIMRSAAGLGDFEPPSQLLLMFSKLRITGFEAEGMEFVRREHFIYYPRELRLRIHDRGVLADFPPPIKDASGIPSWWLLDGGSLVPVLALGLEKGDTLLDVCAAPGGKSLLALLTKLPSEYSVMSKVESISNA